MIPKRSFGPLFYFQQNLDILVGIFLQSFAFFLVQISVILLINLEKNWQFLITSPIFVLKNPALDQVIEK
jgi:hypothetical protein